MRTMTLELPVNYVDVKNNEMEYVDGGFALDIMTVGLAGSLIDSGISAAIRATGYNGSIQTYITKFGAGVAKKLFEGIIENKLKAIGAGKFVTFVETALDTAMTSGDVGLSVAKSIDAVDAKPNNGWITI